MNKKNVHDKKSKSLSLGFEFFLVRLIVILSGVLFIVPLSSLAAPKSSDKSDDDFIINSSKNKAEDQKINEMMATHTDLFREMVKLPWAKLKLLLSGLTHKELSARASIYTDLDRDFFSLYKSHIRRDLITNRKASKEQAGTLITIVERYNIGNIQKLKSVLVPEEKLSEKEIIIVLQHYKGVLIYTSRGLGNYINFQKWSLKNNFNYKFLNKISSVEKLKSMIDSYVASI